MRVHSCGLHLSHRDMDMRVLLTQCELLPPRNSLFCKHPSSHQSLVRQIQALAFLSAVKEVSRPHKADTATFSHACKRHTRLIRPPFCISMEKSGNPTCIHGSREGKGGVRTQAWSSRGCKDARASIHRRVFQTQTWHPWKDPHHTKMYTGCPTINITQGLALSAMNACPIRCTFAQAWKRNSLQIPCCKRHVVTLLPIQYAWYVCPNVT